MDRTNRKKAVIVATVALLAVVFVTGAFWLDALRDRLVGPTPYDQRGLQRLRAVALSAGPVIAALGRYRHSHGTFPASLSALPPASTVAVRSNLWYYDGSRNSYVLYYKISWDPGLRYVYVPGDRAPGTTLGWEYDPGNGYPEVNISAGVAPRPGG